MPTLSVFRSICYQATILRLASVIVEHNDGRLVSDRNAMSAFNELEWKHVLVQQKVLIVFCRPGEKSACLSEQFSCGQRAASGLFFIERQTFEKGKLAEKLLTLCRSCTQPAVHEKMLTLLMPAALINQLCT